jgi:uncharacterized protein
MRSKVTLLLIVASLLSLSARADDASKLAKIHELFKIAKFDQMTSETSTEIIERMRSQTVQELLTPKLTPNQQQKLDEFTTKVTQVTNGALSWASLEPDYARLYDNTYSEEQIDDLIAFYKSPTGQAMVEKTPILAHQAAEITQQHMAAAMPQIKELLREFEEPTVIDPQEDPNAEK